MDMNLPNGLEFDMRQTHITIAQERESTHFIMVISRKSQRARGLRLHWEYEASQPFTPGQPSGGSTTPRDLPSRKAFSSNMSSGIYHGRVHHQDCGSEPNHSSTHQPKDEAGVVWKKISNTCLPMYTDKDREQKIKYVADKLNNDFEKRKKTGQCFPTRK